MTGRDHKINKKMRLKQGQFQHLHVSKDASMRYHYGEIPPNPFWEISMLGCFSEVHVCL